MQEEAHGPRETWVRRAKGKKEEKSDSQGKVNPFKLEKSTRLLLEEKKKMGGGTVYYGCDEGKESAVELSPENNG